MIPSWALGSGHRLTLSWRDSLDTVRLGPLSLRQFVSGCGDWPRSADPQPVIHDRVPGRMGSVCSLSHGSTRPRSTAPECLLPWWSDEWLRFTRGRSWSSLLVGASNRDGWFRQPPAHLHRPGKRPSFWLVFTSTFQLLCVVFGWLGGSSIEAEHLSDAEG
jgi:hypothetical protein